MKTLAEELQEIAARLEAMAERVIAQADEHEQAEADDQGEGDDERGR